LKQLFVKYKSVIQFILTFVLVYVILSMLYKLYLNYYDDSPYPDYITNLVARQSESLIAVTGYDAQLSPHPNEPSIKMIVNGKYIGRIIEGCNSINVLILFVSFIIAFKGRWKTTVLYLFSGSVFIYTVNLIRIAILSIGLYEYPEKEELLHTIIFPIIIYGIVFLLWMFWVNRFKTLNAKHE